MACPMKLQLGHFASTPLLRYDGSNFASWYETLRDMLARQNLLFTLEEPLGEAPGLEASSVEYIAF